MHENTTIGDGYDGFPSPRRDEPDAHGQAGLLLAESILHALVDARVLSLDQAIDAVGTAAGVKVDVAEETGESSGNMHHSLNLLAAIGRSLNIDGSVAANEA